MEENERDLAAFEKEIQKISEKINTAVLNGKDYITVEDGKSIIRVEIKKSLEEKNSYDIKFGGKKIATVKKGEKVPSDKVKSEIVRYQNRFNISKLGRNPTEKEKSNPKSLSLEEELKQAIAEGRVEKLRFGREITSAGEDLSIIMKRMFGERAHEAYRVKDKGDSHKFKYIGIGNDGKYFEPSGSRANEGTNAKQQCWIQNNNGSFEKKTVDDMMVFGKYVMATDINVTTDSTRTLIGQRTPRGEYILMPVLDNRISNASSNSYIKDNLARGNSIWEIDDIILAAELGEKIRGTKRDGKLSANEVEFIRKLKKEGVTDEKVRNIVDAILIIGDLKEQELNDVSIKELLNSLELTTKELEELKREDFSDKEIKEVMDLVHNGKKDFDSAKKEVVGENRRSDMAKVRGEVRKRPWEE